MPNTFEEALEDLVKRNWYFKHVDYDRKLIFIAGESDSGMVLFGFNFNPKYDCVILKIYTTEPSSEELMSEVKWQLDRGNIFFDCEFNGQKGSHSSNYSYYSTEHERFRKS